MGGGGDRCGFPTPSGIPPFRSCHPRSSPVEEPLAGEPRWSRKASIAPPHVFSLCPLPALTIPPHANAPFCSRMHTPHPTGLKSYRWRATAAGTISQEDHWWCPSSATKLPCHSCTSGKGSLGAHLYLMASLPCFMHLTSWGVPISCHKTAETKKPADQLPVFVPGQPRIRGRPSTPELMPSSAGRCREGGGTEQPACRQVSHLPSTWAILMLTWYGKACGICSCCLS